MEENCVLEADFEFVEESPITIDLEVKQYFDGAGQIIQEVLFEESDWSLVQDTEEYTIEYNKEKYLLEDFIVNSIMLWDEEIQQYKPALCDYTLTNIYEYETVLIDTIITLYSETPCKGKIILFGQVLTEG